jgi:hypothetical protein
VMFVAIDAHLAGFSVADPIRHRAPTRWRN